MEKSRRMRWAVHVARVAESRGLCRVFVGNPEGKIPLGRIRRRWDNNITVDLPEVISWGMDWIDLAQDTEKVASCCECGNEPSGFIKYREFLD
jgi:hypothetical protein